MTLCFRTLAEAAGHGCCDSGSWGASGLRAETSGLGWFCVPGCESACRWVVVVAVASVRFCGGGSVSSRARSPERRRPADRASSAFLPSVARTPSQCLVRGWGGWAPALSAGGWLSAAPSRDACKREMVLSAQLFPQSTGGLEPTPWARCSPPRPGSQPEGRMEPCPSGTEAPLSQHQSCRPVADPGLAVGGPSPRPLWGQSRARGWLWTLGAACCLERFVSGTACPAALGSLLGGGPPAGCAPLGPP